MSEAEFIHRQMHSFLQAHPKEDGWKVYEYPGVAARRQNLPYLLDCLQEQDPETITRRSSKASSIR